ncbi:hypothetical protein BJV82DRAFT_674199 [Fennellomyces sp. T-0311]|nr:hypothetical protein BJV82DRAFT_674199 [Fennellomyces sp. T-0311]
MPLVNILSHFCLVHILKGLVLRIHQQPFTVSQVPTLQQQHDRRARYICTVEYGAISACPLCSRSSPCLRCHFCLSTSQLQLDRRTRYHSRRYTVIAIATFNRLSGAMPSLPTLPSLYSLPLFSSLPTLSPTGVETIKELSFLFYLSFFFVAAYMQPPRCSHPSPPPTSPPPPPPTSPLPSPASPLPSSSDDDDDAAVACLGAASEEEEDVGAEDIGDEEVAEQYDEAGNEEVGEGAVEHVTDNDKDDAVVDLIKHFALLSVFDTMDHLAERFSLILLLDEDIEMPQAKADEDIVMVRAPPLGPEHMVVDQRWPAASNTRSDSSMSRLDSLMSIALGRLK